MRATEGDAVREVMTRRGHSVCWDKYCGDMSEAAQALFQSLIDLPLDEIERRGKSYYLAKRVAPAAGGGFHPRLARRLAQRAGPADVEVFSPRKAALGVSSGFRRIEVSVLMGAADQGDIVFFRARLRRDLEMVAAFFATSPLLTERSRGG